MRKQLSYILILVFIFSSCKKETNLTTVPGNTNTNSTTITQDKQNISNTLTSMETCITVLKNGYGANALKNFLNLDQGEVLADDWIEDMIDNIDEVLELDALEDNNKFDYSTNTGTYNWNSNTQSWTKLNNSNKIIINFPDAEWNQNNNNAVFTFHSYTDVSIFYDGENIFAPTSVIADLYVDGVKVFDIAGSYSYDIGNPTPIPININTTLSFDPFSISIIASRIMSTKFEAEISITDNSGCLTTLEADVTIAHNDYENLEETDIVEINTILSHASMEIRGYMDGSLFAYEDPSNNQVNAMTDVEMYYSSSKVGELIMQSDSQGDPEVYIVYNDGSSEDVEVYYNPFITNIEQILFPFMGEWD